MTKLNENLPIDGQQLRSALDGNFHLLNEAIDFEDRQTLEELVHQYAREEVRVYDKEIHDEIRAIILPPLSPLEVTWEIVNARTDSKGHKHASLNERIVAEINYMKEGETDARV